MKLDTNKPIRSKPACGRAKELSARYYGPAPDSGHVIAYQYSVGEWNASVFNDLEVDDQFENIPEPAHRYYGINPNTMITSGGYESLGSSRRCNSSCPWTLHITFQDGVPVSAEIITR